MASAPSACLRLWQQSLQIARSGEIDDEAFAPGLAVRYSVLLRARRAFKRRRLTEVGRNWFVNMRYRF